ncbi:dihydrofolate reductase [Allofustis seminis]|uniref:dihydrofolate reductase n=1 Tax=Allofustis seminis TaxID=166939 RepID=UPI00036481E1|nr:dihydrofolate reductase [Allofustis seminis]
MTINKNILNRLKEGVTPITFVWAQDMDGGIGNRGTLPWKLPADMQYFKEVTWDGIVVMGRKTYESIPHPPLKNRKNFILTRQDDFEAAGCHIYHDSRKLLEDALTYQLPIHIIGGASVYQLYRDDVNLLLCTKLLHHFQTDVKMPELNWSNFELIDSKKGELDNKNIYDHVFETYIKKSAMKE